MEEDSPVPLDGIVEVDETWIGGKRKGSGTRWREHKTMILGAVERGGELRLEVRKGPGAESKASYRGFVKDAVDDKAEFIFTDSDYSWGDMTTWDTKHRKVDHGREEWVRGIVHTNTIEGVWSLFKRSVVGTYHQLSAKHLPAYLDEMAFRFNNRDNAFLFRDTLLRMIHGETLPYAELVAEEAA
jgi:transposase-like protein